MYRVVWMFNNTKPLYTLLTWSGSWGIRHFLYCLLSFSHVTEKIISFPLIRNHQYGLHFLAILDTWRREIHALLYSYLQSLYILLWLSNNPLLYPSLSSLISQFRPFSVEDVGCILKCKKQSTGALPHRKMKKYGITTVKKLLQFRESNG